MEKLVDNFVVKSIGLSNFNEKQIEHLYTSARCLPVTNQFDCHPYLMQHELCGICKSKNMAVTVYNPFGSTTLLEDLTVTITFSNQCDAKLNNFVCVLGIILDCVPHTTNSTYIKDEK